MRTASNPFAISVREILSLEQAVNGLAVGEWLEFVGPESWPGGTEVFWLPNGYGDWPQTQESITNFNHMGVHDPSRGKIVFVGAGYGHAGLVVYDETSDVWSMYAHDNDIIHGWDHAAYDPSTGTFYYGSHLGGGQFSVPIDAPADLTSGLPAPWGGNVDTYGMEYFPERDAVLFGDREGNVMERPVGGSVSTLATGGPLLHLHQFMSYNPVRRAMYWGGGQDTRTTLHEISDTGALSAAPANSGNPGVDCTRQHAACGDVTGDLVVIDFAAGEVHGYAHGVGWTQQATAFPPVLIDTSPVTLVVPLRGYADKEAFMAFRPDANVPSNVYCFLYRYS